MLGFSLFLLELINGQGPLHALASSRGGGGEPAQPLTRSWRYLRCNGQELPLNVHPDLNVSSSTMSGSCLPVTLSPFHHKPSFRTQSELIRLLKSQASGPSLAR